MTEEKLDRSLGRLESKVDILLERTTEFDKRLGAVEKKVYWASGASAILAYIASYVIGKH